MEIVKIRFFLPASLNLADKLLTPTAQGMDLADNDPLHLPPLLTPGRAPEISADALRTMAAMYLQSEMEQAALIPIVEALAEARYRLPLTNPATAQKLEDFASPANHQYNRDQREMFFARLFGTGRGATLQRNSTVNNEFQNLLANFCNGLRNYSTGLGWAHMVSASAESQLRQAAINVIMNLAPRQFGSTLIAGHNIGDQLRRAIDILNDPAIQTYFQARNLWDTVRKALGDQTPDLGRLVTRAQAGMRLVNWLADALPALSDTRVVRPLATASDPIFAIAAQWLDASGLLTPGASRVA